MTLYLQRVEVSGIRSIGWSSDGGPGLVLADLGRMNIVYAPNGVGKTSLVDALTVALAGDSRRRGDVLSYEALVHTRGNGEHKARVLLGFSGGEPLCWEQQTGGTGDPSAAALRHQVAQLLSAETKDAAVVSNLFRLTHLLPQGWGERFSDQKGSARWALVERALGLDDVRAAVSKGQGRGSVRTALSELSTKKTQVADAASSAVERWKDAEERWLRAREGARDSGGLSPEEREVELDAIAAELGLQSNQRSIGLLRGAVEQRRATLRNDLATADRLARRREELEGELAGAHALSAQAADALRAAEARLEAARSNLLRADGAAAREALPDLRASLRRAEAGEAACALLTHASALDRHEEARREAEDRLSELPAQRTLDSEVADAEAVEATARAEWQRARRELDDQEREHGEMASLLAALRPHAVQDCGECPVCGTGFSGTELLDRMDERARRLGDAATLEARERETEANARLKDSTSAASTARARRDDVVRGRTGAAGARDEALRGIEAVRAFYPEELTKRAERDPTDLAGALRARAQELVGSTEMEGLTSEEARQARDTAVRKVLVAEEAVRACEGLAFDEAEVPSVDLARIQRDQAQQAVADAREVVATSGHKITTTRKVLDALPGEWASIGLPELANTPVEELPARLDAVRDARNRKLDSTAARLDVAEQSAVAFSRSVAVRNAQEALLAEARALQVDAPDEITDAWISRVARQLKDREVAAKEAARLVDERVHTVSDRIGVLAKELQRYEDECLQTLDPTVDRFLDALAPTMRWRLKLTKYRKEARTQIVDGPDADPSDILSEGEHTAVALAYLLALHTRFTWSRWPALVLDDPFQAADVVRVGALLDLLRGMSLARGTQILLTTHDPQVAEWAHRKMRNGGVDVRRYDLERTAEGVRAFERAR